MLQFAGGNRATRQAFNPCNRFFSRFYVAFTGQQESITILIQLIKGHGLSKHWLHPGNPVQKRLFVAKDDDRAIHGVAKIERHDESGQVGAEEMETDEIRGRAND
jgi:hypothetical protein